MPTNETKFFRLVNGLSDITFPHGYGISLVNYSNTLCENWKNNYPYREQFVCNKRGVKVYSMWYATNTVELVVKNPDGNWITDQIFDNTLEGKLGWVTPNEYSQIFAIVQIIDNDREIMSKCLIDRDYVRINKGLQDFERHLHGENEVQTPNTDRFAMLEHISIADEVGLL